MNLNALHDRDNAKVFSIGPFGDDTEVVCCLRTHPLFPSVVELDVVPMAGELASNHTIVQLWKLLDEEDRSADSDPFAEPFHDPFDDRDPFDDSWHAGDTGADHSQPEMPGETLETTIDSNGAIRVREEISPADEVDFYPLPTDRTRDLAICCLAGRSGDFLTGLVDLMRREWGLTEEECPVIDRETIEALDSLLATGHNQKFSKAIDLFDGCRDERTTEGVGWYVDDAVLGWRSQAAGEYPLLAGILASEPVTRAAIDGGRPLLPALKSVFPGLTKGGLKRLGQIGGQSVRQTPVCDRNATPLTDPDLLGHHHDRCFVLTGEWQLRDAIKTLTEIDSPSIIPNSTREWDAYATLYGGLICPLRVTMGLDPEPAIRAGKGHWSRLLKQLSSTLELPEGTLLDRHQAIVLVTDLMEMCNDLARTVFLPAMTSMVWENADIVDRQLPQHGHRFNPELGPASFRLARDVLMGEGKGNPLLHCCQLIRRWTPRINSLNNIMVEAESENDRAGAAALNEEQKKWERDLVTSQPATDEMTINGVVFTPLNTDCKLTEEGRVMRHCIASYTKRLLKGDAVIYHLQMGDKTATLCLKPKELGRGEGAFRFHWDGLHGVRNARPDARITEAANRFIKGLDDGQIPVHEEFTRWREWAKARSWRREDPNGCVQDYSGYSRNNLNLHRTNNGLLPLTAKLWEEWRGITRCKDHPCRIIAKDPDNSFAMLLAPGCSLATINGLKGRVLGHPEYLAQTPMPVVPGNGDHSQPTLN